MFVCVDEIYCEGTIPILKLDQIMGDRKMLCCCNNRTNKIHYGHRKFPDVCSVIIGRHCYHCIAIEHEDFVVPVREVGKSPWILFEFKLVVKM